MPADYHINADEGLIAVRIEGQVDLVDSLELCKRLLADPLFDSALPQLIDLRGMQLTLEDSATRPFSSFVTQQYNTTASVAVVVDPDLDTELCAGIYWLSCTLEHSEMFECYDQALKWLMKREFANNEVPIQPFVLAKQPDVLPQ